MCYGLLPYSVSVEQFDGAANIADYSTVLLFVFWYCHKRGKEVRLDKERQLTESEVEKLDEEFKGHGDEIPTTTAEKGASIEEVQAGIKEVEIAKEAASKATLEPDKPVDPALVPPSTVP